MWRAVRNWVLLTPALVSPPPLPFPSLFLYLRVHVLCLSLLRPFEPFARPPLERTCSLTHKFFLHHSTRWTVVRDQLQQRLFFPPLRPAPYPLSSQLVACSPFFPSSLSSKRRSIWCCTMVQLLKAAFVGAAVLATAAYAQLKKECGDSLGKCPESKPCCSRTFLRSPCSTPLCARRAFADVVVQNMASAESAPSVWAAAIQSSRISSSRALRRPSARARSTPSMTSPRLPTRPNIWATPRGTIGSPTAPR
jgi:hypothetical protein